MNRHFRGRRKLPTRPPNQIRGGGAAESQGSCGPGQPHRVGFVGSQTGQSIVIAHENRSAAKVNRAIPFRNLPFRHPAGSPHSQPLLCPDAMGQKLAYRGL